MPRPSYYRFLPQNNFSEQSRLLSSSLCSFLHSPVTQPPSHNTKQYQYISLTCTKLKVYKMYRTAAIDTTIWTLWLLLWWHFFVKIQWHFLVYNLCSYLHTNNKHGHHLITPTNCTMSVHYIHSHYFSQTFRCYSHSPSRSGTTFVPLAEFSLMMTVNVTAKHVGEIQ